MPVLPCQKPGPVDLRESLAVAIDLLTTTSRRLEEARGILAEVVSAIPLPAGEPARRIIHEADIEARKLGLGS